MRPRVTLGTGSYWLVDGWPTLLRGGSSEDNQFQWPLDRLTPELDLLASCGGNFIRNTMSDRDEGDVKPYEHDGSRFLLDRFNDEYFRRLDTFLAETAKRGIVVQLTLWDQHDCTGESWKAYQWNPENNGIGLHGSRIYDPIDLYATVARRNALVLPYQTKLVDRILDLTLAWDHVLYNITNEGWAGIEWELHWARRIHYRAARAGKRVYVTTMEHGAEMSVDAVIEHPDAFDYFEVSQANNAATGYRGRDHYEYLLRLREKAALAGIDRPFVSEKVYGSDESGKSSFGDADEAVRRFWHHLFAGTGVIRFHRPTAGIGLGERAQATLRAVSMLLEAFDLSSSSPRIDLAVGSGACALRDGEGRTAVYFPQGSSADPADAFHGEASWLDLSRARWGDAPADDRRASWIAVGRWS